MSEEQLVEAYLEGRIGRRTFIRRLVAAGVSLSAAVSYTHLLSPAPARADHVEGHYESPAVVTTDASDLAGESAILNAQVDPNQLPTTVYFEFGETVPYSSRTPNEVISGNGFQPVGSAVTGLDPGRTYHFRAVASNSIGQAVGEDRTFAIPDPVQPVVTASAVDTDLDDVIRSGALRVLVNADEAVALSLEASMKKPKSKSSAGAKPMAVARGKLSLDSEGAGVAVLKLKPAAKRALKKLDKANLVLRITATDLAGNVSVSKRRLKLS